jgi:hypothetical protein
MTAEKANLAKKIPSSPKKKVLFSTSRTPLADGASCVTFSAMFLFSRQDVFLLIVQMTYIMNLTLFMSGFLCSNIFHVVLFSPYSPMGWISVHTFWVTGLSKPAKLLYGHIGQP